MKSKILGAILVGTALLMSACTTVATTAKNVKETVMTTPTYPAIGKKFESNFGGLVYHLDYAADGKTMTFKSVGKDKAVADDTLTVQYKATHIRDGVYMVTWQENNGITVVRVEDFDNQIVYSNITMPDHQFMNLKGTFKPLK